MTEIVSTVPNYLAFVGSLGSAYSVLESGDLPLGNTAGELRLCEVSPQVTDAGFSSYSLVFQSKVPLATGQGCYALRHDNLGAFEVFLVPIQGTTGHAEYQAIFTQQAIQQPESED